MIYNHKVESKIKSPGNAILIELEEFKDKIFQQSDYNEKIDLFMEKTENNRNTNEYDENNTKKDNKNKNTGTCEMETPKIKDCSNQNDNFTIEREKMKNLNDVPKHHEENGNITLKIHNTLND